MAVLPAAAYGDYKDVNAAWIAGALTLGDGAVALDGSQGLALPEDLRDAWEERAAIIECAGGLTRSLAERAGGRCLMDAAPQ